MWHSLDIVYPWDFFKDERKIKSDNNLNGLNYLTQLYQWGNDESGTGFEGQQIRASGPTGYLGKFHDGRREELESLDYLC